MTTSLVHVTAKVRVAAKSDIQGDKDQVAITFHPDYTDGRNAEWAKNTPALALEMNVVRAIADLFEPGQAITLTFTPSDSNG